MKHTAEGEVLMETEIYLREEDRKIEGDVNIDNELEYYGKVRMKPKITRATLKYAYNPSLTPWS